MRKIYNLVIVFVLSLFILTGCNNKGNDEFKTLLESTKTEIEEVFALVLPLYEKSSIDEELYNDIVNLRVSFDEIEARFNNNQIKDYEAEKANVEKIASDIKDYRSKISVLFTASEEDWVSYALDIKIYADKLAPLMESAFDAGTINEERYKEFNDLYEKINELTTNKSILSDEEKARLVAIKDSFANMASQVAASNDIIDGFVNSLATQEALDQLNTEDKAQTNDDNKSTEVQGFNHEVIEAYLALQNEASRAFEMGAITQDEYTMIIEIGIEVASIKEEIDETGDNAELIEKLESLKPKMKELAERMDSDLADKFS